MEMAPNGAQSRQPDWLLNLLTVSGPMAEVVRFREAARGAVIVPWRIDFDYEEIKIFETMASAGEDARVLARQLREVLELRRDRLLTRTPCPFDLHRLIPVPDHILQLDQENSAAQAWLRTNWGTLHGLRRVRIREEGADRRLRRKAEIVYEFVSADWTPWQAILQLRRDWPKLVIAVQPHYRHD